MALNIKFKKSELKILNKLAIRLKAKGSEYRYVPVWFRKIDDLTYEILTFDKLPKELLEQLSKEKAAMETDKLSRIITAEHPLSPSEFKSHIIKPFRT